MRTPGHGKYRTFLEKHGISKSEAARAVGVTHAAVHGWLEEHSTPTPERQRAIEVWTGGEVVEDDWQTEEERKAIEDELARVKPFAADSDGSPAA